MKIGIERWQLRTTFALLIVTIFAIADLACRRLPPDTSPDVVAIVRADEVVVAMNTLQRTAIELNKIQRCDTTGANCGPVLSEANTKLVVSNVVSALQVMGPNPTNVKDVVGRALDEIESRLDAAGRTTLLPYVQAARIVAGLIAQTRTGVLNDGNIDYRIARRSVTDRHGTDSGMAAAQRHNGTADEGRIIGGIRTASAGRDCDWYRLAEFA